MKNLLIFTTGTVSHIVLEKVIENSPKGNWSAILIRLQISWNIINAEVKIIHESIVLLVWISLFNFRTCSVEICVLFVTSVFSHNATLEPM